MSDQQYTLSTRSSIMGRVIDSRFKPDYDVRPNNFDTFFK